MKLVCVIPARLKSSRFPAKILAPLQGKPLIQWVWEAACSFKSFSHIVIAADAPETMEVARQFGADVLYTEPTCKSGTMRLVELKRAKKIEGDLFVCWQGDEPFIHAAMIADLIQSAPSDGANVWTLKKRITDLEEVHSPHIVKVVTDASGHALYFSRSPIPYFRDAPVDKQIYYKHIGLYAYSPEALDKIALLPPSFLEEAEKLEQLSFLEHGLKICVHKTEHETLGIDLPEHLIRAHGILNRLNFV
ncbi:MAG: 3-deoxy-manno-octulosonate cytidylyltransferase [Verrucomicrobia bacterium]|nr:3-deoxy-manno-octulosonate cytidylyltransferase [Verrucomicrobiota bacterium]